MKTSSTWSSSNPGKRRISNMLALAERDYTSQFQPPQLESTRQSVAGNIGKDMERKPRVGRKGGIVTFHFCL